MIYDVVIIGGGLGGLQCGHILAKNGLNVCIVEKNPVFGGCLQSYRRRGAEGVLTGEVEIVDLTNNVVLTTYNVNFVKFEVEG